MENGQHAFRLKPPKQLVSQPRTEPITSSAQILFSRKAHRKSRGGCIGCKQRRKKCDEGRPKCSLCLAKKIECHYVISSRRACSLNEARKPVLPPSLWPVAASPPILTHSAHALHTPNDLQLLDHFVQGVGKSIAGPDYSHTFTVEVLDIAKEVPFLMHAMLALSACHLQHTVHDGRTYRLPEALHTQLASNGLRQAVRCMRSVRDMDSVLTTSMLLNCLSFCYADWHDDETEGQRGRPSWQWLRIQTGLKSLLVETKPFHMDSIFMPMFTATKTFEFRGDPTNDLDEQLARFCDITPESTNVENIYLDFHTQLAPLVVRRPDVYYLRMYSNAIGGIDERFVSLLEQQDSKALMLFAHWLGLMCSCISWWITRRTSRECWMICCILDKRLKGKDRVLLERPAVACGYRMELQGDFEDLPRPTYYSNVLRALG